MRCYREKKKLSVKQKTGIVIAVILLFVIGILLYIEYVVNPIILQTSEAKVNALAQKAVGSAIFEVVSDTDIYGSLINIIKDNDGNITMISTNAIQMNLLARRLSRLAQQKLDEIGSQGIKIPIGTFSGMPILAGRGPSITITVTPIGAMSTKFQSEFSQAGVNQTLHKIYVNLSASVSIVLPTANLKIQTNTQVLMCESIIVGKVPEAYLNSYSLDEMMNLIPRT